MFCLCHFLSLPFLTFFLPLINICFVINQGDCILSAIKIIGYVGVAFSKTVKAFRSEISLIFLRGKADTAQGEFVKIQQSTGDDYN